MSEIDIKRLLPGQESQQTPEETFARCVICQFRSSLNELIKGSYYCPIHAQLETEKPEVKKLHDRLEKGRTFRSKLFSEIEVQYEDKS